MKKGRKSNSYKFRIAPVKYSGFITSSILFIIVAFGALITFICNLIYLLGLENSDAAIIGEVIVSGLSFIISAIGSYHSVKALINNSFKRQFIESESYKQEIIKTVGEKLSPKYEKSKYDWKTHDEQRYLYSEQVDERLSQTFPCEARKKFFPNQKGCGLGHDLPLKISPKMQQLSADQSEALYQIVKNKRANGTNIFNSDLVRLRTDMLLDGVLSTDNEENIEKLKEEDIEKLKDEQLSSDRVLISKIKLVEIEKTDYYSNATSNDLIYKQLFKYDHSAIFNGKDMTVNGDTLYDLSQCPAANIIGVTTIAITNDRKLVINKQDNNNDFNNDCYVPSGSGSSDFGDLIACRKLEMNTKLDTYTDDLLRLIKCYKSVDVKSDREQFKQSVKQNLDLCTPTVSDNCVYPTKDKDKYENSINTQKDYEKLKKYCKRLNKYTYSFRNFITYGMVRELIEESHVCKTFQKIPDEQEVKELMERTEICGFIRILDRGGKPDFFGITYLDCSSEELTKRFLNATLKVTKKELDLNSSLTDYSEAHTQKYIPLDDLLKCDKFEDLFPVEKDKKVKVSLQLHYLLTIIKNRLIAEEKLKSETTQTALK